MYYVDPQFGDYGNVLSHFFDKNFVKLTFLLKKILKSRFDEKMFGSEFFHTVVWKNEKFSLTEKTFRQINYLVISLVKPLLSRNFCEKSVRENFCNFHTVSVFRKNKSLLSLVKIFRENVIEE